ncbi:MAG: polysaccharide deacetylase family protein [Bacteroidales bacterium]|nr:polysaccharide deacetylase family protein [Bacteroidales bacterium]
MFIEQPPTLYRLLFPEAIWRIKRPGVKAAYLTFDDGPVPEVTPLVLDILDRYGVKATFFMVGDNVARNPRLLDEVRRRGHTVGNHTMKHIQGLHCSWRSYARNIADADALIGSRLFRPPHGLMKRVQMRVVKERYNIIMYDVVTRDYNRRLTPERVFDNVRKYARDGSIIVFHDSIKARERVLVTLPRAIEWLLDNGFTLLPL